MEDFVPFEITKKLKEKGFPQDIQHCIGWYPTEYYKNACIGEYFEGELQEIEDYFADRISTIHIIENEKKGVIAPTISQVLKWLEDKKKIFLTVDIEPMGFFFIINYDILTNYNGEYEFSIYNSTNTYPSSIESAIAGIEYVLDNLI